GLPGRSSLSQFLASHGIPARPRLFTVPITEQQVLAWADAYFQKHGDWPYPDSGRIPGSGGLTWERIDASLRFGLRGLPGGTLLSKFLVAHRQIAPAGCRRPNRRTKPPITVEQIRAWAKEHRKRTGEWPHSQSGPIRSQRGLTWQAVNVALSGGCRGLPGRSSLSQMFGRKKDPRTAAKRRK
ncbi:MAG TPA: hypothetical protein VGH74_02765, partial [Planctomycetaceae bacterium]